VTMITIFTNRFVACLVLILMFYSRAGEMRGGFPFDNLNFDGTGSEDPWSGGFRNWDSDNGE
jgi:hypothetical protein